MGLIKRKQLDLTIKSASAAGLADSIYGLYNLANINAAAYSINTNDQYEIVVDKLASAIDFIGDKVANSYYSFTVDGASEKQVTLGGSVDIGGTTNQISVSKTNLTNGVDYAFSLPSTLITPGSLKVTTTTELVGNITLSAAGAQSITHSGTGNLTIQSTDGNVLIEGVTFAGNNVTIPGTLGAGATTVSSLSSTGNASVGGTFGVTGATTLSNTLNAGATTVASLSSTGNATVGGTLGVTGATTLTGAVDINNAVNISGNIVLDAAGAQSITHSGTGNLTIQSTDGSVLVEGVTFSGNNVTVPGTLGVTGNVTISGNLSVVGSVTQTSVQDVIVQDRFIKLANGNTGSVTVTGLYQQTGTSSFAGLIYNSTENQFRLFTSSTEPTTGSSMGTLTPATLKIGNLDAAQIEGVAFGSNATEAIQDIMNTTLVAGTGITLSYADAGTAGSGKITISADLSSLASFINLQVKTFEDNATPNQYTINLLSESLAFGDSDTALVKKIPSVDGLKVVTRGTIHEEITYSAVVDSPGKFRLSGANAIITLSYDISAAEFVDIQRSKEYVQVYINGVKCRYFECQWTAGAPVITVYGGTGITGSYTGVGFDLDSSDVFTVLYYGDKTNTTVNPNVTTTTTTTSTTTTTTDPTSATNLFETILVNSAGNYTPTAVGVNEDSEYVYIGTSTGYAFKSSNGGATFSQAGTVSGAIISIAVSAIPEDFDSVFLASATALERTNNFGGTFVEITLPGGVSGNLSAVGIAYGMTDVLIGTTSGAVYKAANTYPTMGSWTSVSLGLASSVIGFAQAQGATGALIGVTADGEVFGTLNSGDTYVSFGNCQLSGVTHITAALVDGTVRVVLVNGTSLEYSICTNIAAATPAYATGEFTGLESLMIKGIGFLGNDEALYLTDGSTDIFKVAKANLDGGSTAVSYVESETYPIDLMTSNGIKPVATGNLGSSLYASVYQPTTSGEVPNAS